MKTCEGAVQVSATRSLMLHALSLSVVIVVGCQGSNPPTGQAAKESKDPSTQEPSNGVVQKATIIVDNGFSPTTISVKAGQPVELTFDTKHRSCATSVIFKDLGIEKPLEDGKQTVVTFTPKTAGTIAYACPMNMLKGSIQVN